MNRRHSTGGSGEHRHFGAPHGEGGSGEPEPRPRTGGEPEPGTGGSEGAGDPGRRRTDGGGDGGGDGGAGSTGEGGASGEGAHGRGDGSGEGEGGTGTDGEGGANGEGGGVNIDVGGITFGGDDGQSDGEGTAGDEGLQPIDGAPDDGGAGWDGGGSYAPGPVGSGGLYPLPAQGGGAGGQTSGDPADFEATESRLEQAARDFETATDRLANLGERLSSCLSNDSLTSSAAEPGQEICDKIHEISGKLAAALATTGHRLGDQGRALRQADQSARDRFNGLDDRAPDVPPPTPAAGGGGQGSPAGGGAGGGSAPPAPTPPHPGGGGGGGGAPAATGIDSTNPLVTPPPASPAVDGAAGDGGAPAATVPAQATGPLPTSPGIAAGVTGSADGTVRMSGAPAAGTGSAPEQPQPVAGVGAAPTAPERIARPLTAGSGLEVGLRAEAHTLGLSAADTDRVVATLEASPQGERAAETIASGRFEQRPGFSATVSMLAHPGTAPAALHHLDLAAQMSEHGIDDVSFEGGKDGLRADTGLVARGEDGQSYSYRFKDPGDPSQLVRTAQKELWQTVNSGTDHQVLWLRTSGSLDDLQADGTVRQLTELYSRQRAQFVVETDSGRLGIPAGGRFFPWNEEIR